MFKKFLITVLILLACGAAFAAQKVELASDNPTAVAVNGKVCVRFRVANGDMTPIDRADLTVRRLAALASELKPGGFSVKPSGDKACVYFGENLICIATPADAKAAGSDVMGLANRWAKQLSACCSVPSPALSSKNVTVPLGESRTVKVTGAPEGAAIKVACDNASVAVVTLEGKTITVTGKAVGVAKCTVTVGSDNLVLNIYVKEYAGTVEEVPAVEVTGTKCPWGIIKPLALDALRASVKTKPGAAFKLDTSGLKSFALTSGNMSYVKLPVAISGEGYITVNTTTRVLVKNVAYRRNPPAVLFYSNEPEMIKRYQTLYVAKAAAGKTTRVLYHHQNMMNANVHFTLEVINPSSEPVKFHLLSGISEPHIDTILVGHVAGNEFMRNYDNNIGCFRTLPAHSRCVIVSDNLKNKITSSGILEIAHVSGEDIYVKVTAGRPGADGLGLGKVGLVSAAISDPLSDHVYPNPVKTLDYEYEVGKQWTFIPVGKHALTDSTAMKTLYGNYGVTYNLNIKISNPTDTQRTVSVFFDATAGLASGMFRVDGEYMLKKYANSDKEVLLKSYKLSPGQSRVVKLTTIPLSGSNYPVNIIVKSVN